MCVKFTNMEEGDYRVKVMIVKKMSVILNIGKNIIIKVDYIFDYFRS